MNRCGIILAGGLGTRLFPSTRVVSKQLLPVYDKPMIYYPLCTLMLAGIRNILIITTPDDSHLFKNLLGDGSQWGLNIEFNVQTHPKGLAEALLIAEEFISSRPCTLILGDNIFYGHNLVNILANGHKEDGATIYTYQVKDPESYGVATLDVQGNIISVEEKPIKAKSNLAITGLYFYDNTAVDRVKTLSPSPRGELEITDLNAHYLLEKKLFVEKINRGYFWMDTGTPDQLLDAAQFVSLIEKRQGLKISCPEEVAFYLGWISAEKILEICHTYQDNSYKSYLLALIQK